MSLVGGIELGGLDWSWRYDLILDLRDEAVMDGFLVFPNSWGMPCSQVSANLTFKGGSSFEYEHRVWWC